jgi:hypothetical protein
MLLDIINNEEIIVIPDVIDRFGIKEMLSANSKDQEFLASYLYYFGVLTLEGFSDTMQMVLKVPNPRRACCIHANLHQGW